VIWDWWDVQTKGQYAATLLACFLAVVFYRYLIRLELTMARRTAQGGAGGVVVGGAGAGNAELGACGVFGFVCVCVCVSVCVSVCVCVCVCVARRSRANTTLKAKQPNHAI
jgi:hypothetical protein